MKFDITCIIPSSETDGQLAAFEEREPAEGGPPLHAHRHQIEIFHVIEGRFVFQNGGTQTELGPGGSVVIPKGVAHTFKNIGQDTGVLHFELLPAGRSEEFFQRLTMEPESIADVGAFFSEFDIDLLGPPLP